MAGESLFKQLEFEAFRAGITPRTKQSIEWFRTKARTMFRGRVINNRKRVMNDDLISQESTVNKTPIGSMYMFFYDPKHKKTLPYYDGFPLIIMLGPAPNGFYGLNMHYLPPVIRAKALDAILGRGKIPSKYLAPARKHYLTKHVRSKFAIVEEPEWEIATFLPMADWNKASATAVYKDSRKML